RGVQVGGQVAAGLDRRIGGDGDERGQDVARGGPVAVDGGAGHAGHGVQSRGGEGGGAFGQQEIQRGGEHDVLGLGGRSGRSSWSGHELTIHLVSEIDNCYVL